MPHNIKTLVSSVLILLLLLFLVLWRCCCCCFYLILRVHLSSAFFDRFVSYVSMPFFSTYLFVHFQFGWTRLPFILLLKFSPITVVSLYSQYTYCSAMLTTFVILYCVYDSPNFKWIWGAKKVIGGNRIWRLCDNKISKTKNPICQ